ncbi:MAG: UDP-glucose 4-epimerase GalE [Bacteroidales bacterium]|nr:UDP-glucose 4-epimerase GalE [Bacteroidales bacterium]
MPHFEEFDLCNYQKVNDFFTRNQVDAIIHFAALKAVGESVEKPLEYYENNVSSLINLLKAMKKHDVAHIVFSSSCTVYGQPDELPVTEAAPTKKAESPYGNTKQMCEDILLHTSKSNALYKVISLRYFNPIGAHESAIIGELPLGVPQNLVPYITQTAAGLRDQLKVFGNDYNTPDGTCIRDYIHVVDLAKAHVVAITRLLQNKNKKAFEIFNLGTGNGNSVLEAIQAFEKVSGKKLNYTIVDRRPGDIEQVWANTRFANEELGWKAKSSLEHAMKTAWDWEKKIRKIGSTVNLMVLCKLFIYSFM